MCPCGISMQDSVLANGWTVHRSKEGRTLGKLFYVTPDGKTTMWNLPRQIQEQLTHEQIRTLQMLDMFDYLSPTEEYSVEFHWHRHCMILKILYNSQVTSPINILGAHALLLKSMIPLSGIGIFVTHIVQTIQLEHYFFSWDYSCPRKIGPPVFLK